MKKKSENTQKTKKFKPSPARSKYMAQLLDDIRFLLEQNYSADTIKNSLRWLFPLCEIEWCLRESKKIRLKQDDEI